MFMKSKSLVAAAALTVAASGAFAQGQEGLVNVSVDDNTVQVPVSVAANACDLDVNVLSGQFVGSDKTACEIDQETAAANGIDTGSNGGSGNGQQEGLVNLSVDGNTVQVPVGVAANVCDVDANVIAQQIKGTDESACEIDQETAAENGIDTAGLSDSDMTNATDAAEDAAENTVENAEEAAENTVEAGENALDNVEETAEDAQDDLEETVEDATDS
ncbi:hypothetical protein CLV79_101385 [Limimaricola soesokkakensis]|uniref:Uncharacterized protein n=2 Tax=Limimaricola soesokkakensis TaxID=1343159 RepID=A0A1X6YKL3_9RHOB|nr:hypothetical protein CLV79_101385 [Limimaricola soesokkakensis]SLN23372.1 hypothetical protein LOS8367_00702 [Limimaricola soesokkakensis]